MRYSKERQIAMTVLLIKEMKRLIQLDERRLVELEAELKLYQEELRRLKR